MANTKSAQKRARQAEWCRLRNRRHRGAARSQVKRARVLIEAEESGEAQAAVQRAIRALDRAAAKGVIHKNNAARRKSRLMKLHNHASQASADN